jgi:very-short-patch-repair endonuclease
MVVEVDGEVHLKQRASDRERALFLREFDLRVLRFANTDVEKTLKLCYVSFCMLDSGINIQVSGNRNRWTS